MKRFLIAVLAVAFSVSLANAQWGTEKKLEQIKNSIKAASGVYGNVYFVSAKIGKAGYGGTTTEEPCATIAQAYALMSAGDGLVFLDTTAFEMSKPCTVAKANISFIGIPGVTRIVTPSVRGVAASNRTMFLVTGNGVKFYGLDITNQDSVGIRGIETRGRNTHIDRCVIVGGYTADASAGDSIACAAVACSSAINPRITNSRLGTSDIKRAEVAGGILALLGNVSGLVVENCEFLLRADGSSVQGGIRVGAAATLTGFNFIKNSIFAAFENDGTIGAVVSVVTGTAQNDVGIVFHNCARPGFVAWDTVVHSSSFLIQSAPTDSIGNAVAQ